MMQDRGMARALVAALLGIVLAVAGPYALAGVDVAWQRVVLLSLVLACALVIGTSLVLALAYELRHAARGAAHSSRLLMLADIFLISSAGMLLVTAIFSFVLAIIRLA